VCVCVCVCVLGTQHSYLCWEANRRSELHIPIMSSTVEQGYTSTQLTLSYIS